MSLSKTKLCRHWLKHGYCKMDLDCQFIHRDCEHGEMEHGRARMVHADIYHDTYNVNNYHDQPHLSPNYMHDKHKEGFPLDHAPLSRLCKTQVSKHMNVEYFLGNHNLNQRTRKFKLVIRGNLVMIWKMVRLLSQKHLKSIMRRRIFQK